MNEHSLGPDVQAESAYAVYETNGRIVHLHRVTVHGGADAPSSEENLARALDLARRHGHEDAELQVLEISPRDLDGGAPQQVDLATRTLKADPAD
jgi:hypothetical protein